MSNVTRDRLLNLPVIHSFCPPLGDSLLRKCNFFELYPLDGGGSLIFRELFGTLDDMAIARKILKKRAMDDFGKWLST